MLNVGLQDMVCLKADPTTTFFQFHSHPESCSGNMVSNERGTFVSQGLCFYSGSNLCSEYLHGVWPILDFIVNLPHWNLGTSIESGTLA